MIRSGAAAHPLPGHAASCLDLVAEFFRELAHDVLAGLGQVGRFLRIGFQVVKLKR